MIKNDPYGVPQEPASMGKRDRLMGSTSTAVSVSSANMGFVQRSWPSSVQPVPVSHGNFNSSPYEPGNAQSVTDISNNLPAKVPGNSFQFNEEPPRKKSSGRDLRSSTQKNRGKPTNRGSTQRLRELRPRQREEEGILTLQDDEDRPLKPPQP